MTLPSYQLQYPGQIQFFTGYEYPYYQNPGYPGSGFYYLDGLGTSTDYVTIIFAP
jgi:hypothetical protein